MSLNDRQFKLRSSEYEVPSSWLDDPSSESRNEYFLGKDRDDSYTDIHGRVEVSHHSASPYNVETWNAPVLWNRPEQPAPHGEPEYDPEGTGRRISDGQQKLFQEKYESDTPGKSVVDAMYFSKEARAMALPVLAVAARDTAVSHGRILTPSGDRSDHSERLVQGLAKGGAIEPHEREMRNNIDFPPVSQRPTHVLGEERSPAELRQGSREARQLLRAARPRKDKSVQQELFQ